MNLFQRILKFSADLAAKRGGKRDPWARSYDHTVDSREYEAWVDVDGAQLFVSNIKWPERWSECSQDKRYLARAIEAPDGTFRIAIFERKNDQWTPMDGASIVQNLQDAVALGRSRLDAERRNRHP